jgi:hypothetical protein
VRRLAALVALLVAAPLAAAAQTAPNLEFAIGGRWIASHGVSGTDAEATTPSGGQLTLFTTDSSMGSTPAVEARLGFRLSSRAWLAVVGGYGVTSLRTRVSDDVEGVADVTIESGATEFTVGGLVTLELGRRPRRGRSVPILFGGAEFVRDVHEERQVAESGSLMHAGFGLDYHLGSFGSATARPARRRRLKDLALRIDGRVSFRSGGASPDDGVHVAPGFGVLVAFRY